MKALYLKIHPENPSEKSVERVAEVLSNNGIAIYPTDSVYGLGCKLTSKKGIERIALMKGIKPKKAQFSFLFGDIDCIENYTLPLEKWVFRLLKKNLPGPFTFILPANHKIPKILENSRKTIGVRIPDNNIIREIVRKVGEPVLNTSVHDDDEVIEYTTDPELIYERYNTQVDVVVNGGYGHIWASTVVDLTGDEPEIVRQGIGELVL